MNGHGFPGANELALVYAEWPLLDYRRALAEPFPSLPPASTVLRATIVSILLSAIFF
jgi:hypothetical protein